MAKLMNDRQTPLVSVVTPVYNGEKYLAECIESVFAQTYANWEYLIINNFSTDGSLAIAQKYAAKDKRIRVHNNQKFLDLMPNWNHAILQISPHSKYCKFVHADDWIFPECLEKMVNIAEKNPSVGIVSAYRLDEDTVNLDGLPYPSSMVPGHEICRRGLLGGPYVFGSPTSILMRSDLIRKRRPFYNEAHIHADKEACFDLLQESDFGFVHQVLTFTRRHNETETTTSKKLNTYRVGKIDILKKYGPLYLTQTEYEKRLQRLINNYHAYLVKCLFKFKPKSFFEFHIGELKKLNIRLQPLILMRAFFKRLLNLLDTFRIIQQSWKSRCVNKK